MNKQKVSLIVLLCLFVIIPIIILVSNREYDSTYGLSAGKFSIEHLGTIDYIVGSVKNNSLKDCENGTITLTFKSGNIKETNRYHMDTIKSGEKYDIKWRVDYNSNYKVKVEEIKCK